MSSTNVPKGAQSAPGTTARNTLTRKVYSPVGPWTLLVVAALLAHGLMLFNDGVFWDGTLIVDFQRSHNWRALHDMYFEYGTPQLFYFHRFMGQLPQPVFCYKLIGFVSIAYWGLLTYALALETSLLTRRESLILACFTLLYPAFQASPEIIILPYLLCYPLFLAGALLALRAEKRGGLHQRGLQIMALLLFTSSYTINSFLVFHGGFLLLLLICRRQQQGGTWKEAGAWLLRRRWAFLALPACYWVWFRHFYPPYGPIYASYNVIHLTPRSVLRGCYYFLRAAILMQFYTSLKLALLNPLAWLTAIVAAWRLPAFYRRERDTNGMGASEDARACFLFGVVLLGLGIFPYIATEKLPEAHGWYSRNALLVGLPLGVMLIGGLRIWLAPSRIRQPQANGELSAPKVPGAAGQTRLAAGMLTFLLCGFGLALSQSYISWQARWVKTQAIALHLRQSPAWSHYSAYYIRDQFAITEDDHRIFYDWAAVFKGVWGGETRAGLDRMVYFSDAFTEEKMRPFYTDRFLLGHFNRQGPQATLTIRRATNASESALCFQYTYLRLFHPEQLADFLRPLVSVEFQPGRDDTRHDLDTEN